MRLNSKLNENLSSSEESEQELFIARMQSSSVDEVPAKTHHAKKDSIIDSVVFHGEQTKSKKEICEALIPEDEISSHFEQLNEIGRDSKNIVMSDLNFSKIDESHEKSKQFDTGKQVKLENLNNILTEIKLESQRESQYHLRRSRNTSVNKVTNDSLDENESKIQKVGPSKGSKESQKQRCNSINLQSVDSLFTLDVQTPKMFPNTTESEEPKTQSDKKLLNNKDSPKSFKDLDCIEIAEFELKEKNKEEVYEPDKANFIELQIEHSDFKTFNGHQETEETKNPEEEQHKQTELNSSSKKLVDSLKDIWHHIRQPNVETPTLKQPELSDKMKAKVLAIIKGSKVRQVMRQHNEVKEYLSQIKAMNEKIQSNSKDVSQAELFETKISLQMKKHIVTHLIYKLTKGKKGPKQKLKFGSSNKISRKSKRPKMEQEFAIISNFDERD